MSRDAEKLSQEFCNAMLIDDKAETYKKNYSEQGLRSAPMDTYITPQKVNMGSGPGMDPFQQTKPKIKREIGEEDRFSTPPRRPHRPTSEQMEYFLREERDGNRRR